MILPFGLTVIILSVAYCLVNAGVLALLFNYYFKIRRGAVFFWDACGKTFFTLCLMLATQALFLIYYCRFQQLCAQLFGSCAYACYMMTKESIVYSTLPALVIAGLVAIMVQWWLYRHGHYTIDDTDLIGLLCISNAAACCMYYVLLTQLS